MKINSLTAALITALFSMNTNANESVADALKYGMPIAAAGYSLYLDDDEGLKQFAFAFGSTVATTYALKSVVSADRPNGEGDDSFPSGHTAATFSSASFLHKRYGAKVGIPAYLLASYTGYQRYNDDHHRAQDVVAGALIGWAFSELFVDKLETVKLGAVVSPKFSGVSFEVAL